MNRIIIVPGANEDIAPADVDEAFDSLPDPGVVLCQLEIPLPAIRQAFLRGRASGAINILNPAPAGPIDSEIIELATWMIPNEVEFGGLAHGLGLRQNGLEETVGAFRKRMEAGLVVTLGGDGAVLSYAAEPYLAVPAKKVKAVDTTGAGDAFVGAFAYSLAIGVQPAAAVELACACAASSVTRPGTQSSFPRGEELLELRRMISGKRAA
jgi:ribokinase